MKIFEHLSIVKLELKVSSINICKDDNLLTIRVVWSDYTCFQESYDRQELSELEYDPTGDFIEKAKQYRDNHLKTGDKRWYKTWFSKITG